MLGEDNQFAPLTARTRESVPIENRAQLVPFTVRPGEAHPTGCLNEPIEEVDLGFKLGDGLRRSRSIEQLLFQSLILRGCALLRIPDGLALPRNLLTCEDRLPMHS